MAIFFMLNRAYVEGMCTSESMQYEVCHISRPGGIFSTREVPLPYVIPCPCPRRKVNQIPWLYDFHGDPVVKNLPANAVDKGSTPGWGTKVPQMKKRFGRTFLVVQWLRPHAPSVGGLSLIPGQETRPQLKDPTCLSED